jgi:hypothetical protein
MRDAAAALGIEGHARCTRLLAPIVAKRQKFPSSQLKASRYTAENVTRSTGDSRVIRPKIA